MLADPAAWAALATLIAMEVVLGIDNLIFISILTNKLPEEQRSQGAAHRHRAGADPAARPARHRRLHRPADRRRSSPLFGHGFSWRDLILIAGGLFLVWKATKEIHHNVDADPGPDMFDGRQGRRSASASAIGQILLLDLVFSIDSIITAVGMTEHIPIMVVAVLVAVLVMLLAADPLANFINDNPTIVMLALGFLLMIGMTLIAEGFGAHVPEGLHLCRDGLLGPGRGAQHAVAPRAPETGAGGAAGRRGDLKPEHRGPDGVFVGLDWEVEDDADGQGTHQGRGRQGEGRLKDAVGKATGNERMQAEGKADKAKGDVRHAVGNVKDAARDLKK